MFLIVFIGRLSGRAVFDFSVCLARFLLGETTGLGAFMQSFLFRVRIDTAVCAVRGVLRPDVLWWSGRDG